MRSPEDSLTHEATALYRLVDSIDRLVAEQQSSYTYTDSTVELFQHIRTEAAKARKTISSIVAESAERPSDIDRRYRPALMIQKDNWRTLHTYVKPASDAHTLSLPVPLLNLAKVHLRAVNGMGKMEVVPLLTPELMYYENRPRVGAPDHLVFVELPYSQGPGFFTNLAVYHEIAHFVFGQVEAGATEGAAMKELAAAMEQSFEVHLGKGVTSTGNRIWSKRVLQAWTREIFCDLFAVHFLGPAFTFALIDLLSLIGLMRDGSAAVEFDKEHPPPAFRLREQLAQLKRRGWWPTVQALPTAHVTLVETLASTKDPEYQFVVDDQNLPVFIETFLDIVPFISPVVESIVPPAQNAAADFSKTAGDIEKCNLQGVVPSHLSWRGQSHSPTQVSIINAAYCFYLTSLATLMDKMEKDPNQLAKRSELIGKLEGWTLKALEDSPALRSEASIEPCRCSPLRKSPTG